MAETTEEKLGIEEKTDSNSNEWLRSLKKAAGRAKGIGIGLGLFVLAGAATLGGFVMGAGTDKTRDLAAGLMAGPPEVDLPPAPAVVTLPDLIVNRVAGDEAYLKARLAVVTVPGLEAEVQKETPALLDIANGFLPQLDDIDLRGGAGLARTRMELRYRFNLVLEAEDAVTDVLILEIVTN